MNQYPGTLVIIGSNGGLGHKITEHLLSDGVKNVLCHYHNNKDKITSVLVKYGLNPEKHTFYADMTNEEEVAQMKDKMVNAHGKIWAVLNMAGKSANSMCWKTSKAEFVEVINSNLMSVFMSSKVFSPHLRDNKGGRIINFSSVIGYTGVVGAAHYCAAKAGIAGFTRAVALELAGRNITVNALALGYFNAGMIDTVPKAMLESIISMIPLKRLGTTEEAYGIIKFLLSDEGAYTTGQVIHMNGGYYL